MGAASRRWLLVFLGGGSGATARYLIGLWIPVAWAAPLPLAILAINVLGAACLGIVFVLADEAGLLNATTRLTIAVGVLGGFTTWSTFMTGAVTLLRAEQLGAALLYLGLSLVGGPLAVALASAGTRAILATGARTIAYPDLPAEIESIEAEDREALDALAAQRHDRR